MIPTRFHEQDSIEPSNGESDARYEIHPLDKSRDADYLDIISRCHDVGILDCDLLDNGTRHPNLALMKIAGYCLDAGCNVELLEDYSTTYDYDVVFASKVFSFTTIPDDFLFRENVFVGGTGFYPTDGRDLPHEIEHHMPYYDLYKDYVESQIASGRKRSWFADYLDYSIGFLSRGCFRKCSFCVNQKYDHAFLHAPLAEFVDPSRPRIYLWDDNFLACSGWEKALDELEACGKPFQFRQGLDVRLLNDKRARRLAKVNYCGDFIFAFDHLEDKPVIEKKLAIWRKYTNRGTRLYVLCAFDSQDEKDIESVFIRIKTLMKYGCLPYIMRYESYKQSKWRALYVNIARWCNQPQFFKKKSFRDFCETNQLYHKNKQTKCAALRSMEDFEAEFPEIAARYFDLKYEDENMIYRYGRPFWGEPSEEVNIQQSEAWKRLKSADESPSEILHDYYSKKLDIVWLELKCNEERDLASSLFAVLKSASFEEAFIAAVNSDFDEFITAETIPQFSSMEDVERVPEILSCVDEFLSYDDLGIMLSGGARKDSRADKKYGENHGKMSSMMDLSSVEKVSDHRGFSKTLFSEMFCALCEDDQRDMTSKLLLRIPIIRQLAKDSMAGPVKIEDYMVVLSESTIKRRLPNVVRIVDILKSSAEKGSEVDKALRGITRR